MPEWLAADWPAPAGIVAGTTFRHGGVSSGPWQSLNLGGHVGDDPGCVAENRRRFREYCGLPAEPQWLRQVHGTRVVTVPGGDLTVPADAAVTQDPGTVCAVLTADCLPVLFAADDGSAVGAAHAGWRGLAAGILEATMAGLGTPPARLLAWLGPAISAPAFEVGEEVRQAFVEQDAASEAHFRPNERGRWQADLYGLARQRLRAAGVSRIHGGGRCTWGEGDAFYSYRRDGECGRMASFVCRAE